jgi:hypothetical protein
MYIGNRILETCIGTQLRTPKSGKIWKCWNENLQLFYNKYIHDYYYFIIISADKQIIILHIGAIIKKS